MDFETISGQLVEFAKLDVKVSSQFIREAIKDICDNTWIWTEVFAFLTTAGTYEYTLTPATENVEILAIKETGVQRSSVNSPVVTLAAGTSGTLTLGTTYGYQVTAYRGDYGETLAMTAVSLAATATGEIVLSWTAIPGADGYYIYGDNGSGTTYTRMTSTTGVTYDDDGTDTPDGSTEPPTTSVLMREIALEHESNMRAGNPWWRASEGDELNKLIWDGITTIRTPKIPKTSGIGFQVELVIKPTTDYTGDIPSILVPHADAILAYVRYRVYMSKGSDKDAPYYNRKLGADWYGQYRVSRAAIKAKTMRGFGGKLRVRMRRFV